MPKIGHTAKFCRESPESHAIEPLSETPNSKISLDFVTLPEANRIILKLKVGGHFPVFLCDPVSQFTLIPKNFIMN